ncbi:MAG: hypothetical protein IH945_04405 [Armatimonadetes bacterium]|nr:hypothetical protein [Armatimonadota bacterium]
MKFNLDLSLYASIAGLGAAQAYIVSGDLPGYLAPVFGVALAMLVAVKAKRSGGKDEADKI